MIKIQYTSEPLSHFKTYLTVLEIFYLFIVSEDAKTKKQKKDADSVRHRMLRHVTLLQS